MCWYWEVKPEPGNDCVSPVHEVPVASLLWYVDFSCFHHLCQQYGPWRAASCDPYYITVSQMTRKPNLHAFWEDNSSHWKIIMRNIQCLQFLSISTSSKVNKMWVKKECTFMWLLSLNRLFSWKSQNAISSFIIWSCPPIKFYMKILFLFCVCLLC